MSGPREPDAFAEERPYRAWRASFAEDAHHGSAVRAAMSRWALDQGARDVLLFTDLANPTSNSIYQKLGYRPVYDAVDYRFRTRLG